MITATFNSLYHTVVDQSQQHCVPSGISIEAAINYDFHHFLSYNQWTMTSVYYTAYCLL